MNLKLDGWNCHSVGFIDLEILRRPTQEYQDSKIFASNGCQPRARYITPTDDVATLFDNDGIANKLAK